MNVLQSLQNLNTIRQQSYRLLALAKEKQLNYFTYNEKALAAAADFVIEIIDEQYPSLNIPYHSRWRHFEVGNIDRISCLKKEIATLLVEQQGKILFELAIISVLLDAGAGNQWHFIEPGSGFQLSRSEGLAVASLNLYLNGAFSASKKTPYRVDAEKLISFNQENLARGFQITAENPLAGIEGRVALLNQLGHTLKNYPSYFGQEGRLGSFYSYIYAQQNQNNISAADLFKSVLTAFNDIWPKRLHYQGVPLGDVWQHSALKTEIPGSEFIPFHKLSQWLTYSLIEPLQETGLTITDLNKLTGLAEYRNGGLFIDTGVLSVKDKNNLDQFLPAGSEIIVEWRALTIAALDELALLIRKQLNLTPEVLPLAKILQGGTWEAGRRIAKIKRKKGVPPLQIISDGTLF